MGYTGVHANAHFRPSPHRRRAAAGRGRPPLPGCLRAAALPDPAGQRPRRARPGDRPGAGLRRRDDPPGAEAAGGRLEARQALDHQPRSGVPAEKSARDRLIRLAASHPDWALGFEDEVWWSRLAQPALSAWAAGDQPLRLVERAVAKEDPDPKALACYGLLARWADGAGGWQEQAWLRFVDGRPVSALTTQYVAWCCARLGAAGKTALRLVWDNAAWHVSTEVRAWLHQPNRRVK